MRGEMTGVDEPRYFVEISLGGRASDNKKRSIRGVPMIPEQTTVKKRERRKKGYPRGARELG